MFSINPMEALSLEQSGRPVDFVDGAGVWQRALRIVGAGDMDAQCRIGIGLDSTAQRLAVGGRRILLAIFRPGSSGSRWRTPPGCLDSCRRAWRLAIATVYLMRTPPADGGECHDARRLRRCRLGSTSSGSAVKGRNEVADFAVLIDCATPGRIGISRPGQEQRHTGDADFVSRRWGSAARCPDWTEGAQIGSPLIEGVGDYV